MVQPVNAQSLINLIIQVALEANIRQLAMENGQGPYIVGEEVSDALNNFARKRGKASRNTGKPWDYREAMEDSAMREMILDVSEAAIEAVIAHAEWNQIREHSVFDVVAEANLPAATHQAKNAERELKSEVQSFLAYVRRNASEPETGTRINPELAAFAQAMEQVALADNVHEVRINPDIEAMRRFQQAIHGGRDAV